MSSPNQRKSPGAAFGRVESTETPPNELEERENHQLQQDIDAARQMSRATRASSITQGRGEHSHQKRGKKLQELISPLLVGPASPVISPGMGRRPTNVLESLGGEEDVSYFRNDGIRTSPVLERGLPPHQGGPAHSPLSLGASSGGMPISGGGAGATPAHLARFYRSQGRRGSNSSVDSEQHFIDHRHQQHSLSTSAYQRSYQPASSMRSPNTFMRRGQGAPPNESAIMDDDDAEDNHDDADEGAGKQSDLSGLSALDDPRSAQGGGSGIGGGAGAALSPDKSRGARDVSPHTASRRPSLLEDDVCFPGPQLASDEHPAEMYHDEYLHHEQDGMHHHHALPEDGRDLPPGYPFNFDLQALQDFASEERNRVEQSSSFGARAGAGGLRHRGAGGGGVGGGVRNARQLSVASAAAYGISPDSDDATFYSRRPRKFTQAETSTAKGVLGGSKGVGGNLGGSGSGGSKYQRKLAMFESGADAGPPTRAGRASHGNIMGGGALLEADRNRHHADAETPLLGDKAQTPNYDSAYGEREDEAAGLGRSYSSGFLGVPNGKAGADKEKPYRFTFYSNSLPSTIHARHLFEIPAPGQTFEDLLRGRPPSDEDEDSNDKKDDGKNGAPRGASLGSQGGRMEGATAPPTRSATPVLHDAARSNVASPQPGGLSAARFAMTKSVLTGTSAAGGNGAGSASNSTHAATAVGTNGGNAAKSGKMLPGGGISMDQDPEANTWWLDVLCPTDQEMKLLSRAFGIHPLTTEDILMEETREKIELFRNYYLVCFRSFDQDPYSPTYLEPLNMYIIVFREGTLSFHFRATPHPQNVRRRIKQLKDYINVTSDWISYALIDDITDAFGPLIQSIEYEVDSIDELVLILKEAEQSDMLRRIGTCRKKVMGLLRLMGNKADVVKGLAKRCNENWSVAPKSDIGLYLSDIQDHLITMTQNLNHYEKILSRSHSNYLAQISIEMTDANNQINDVLSKLTALGTVIVPLNIITGLWGMNVHVPGQDTDNLNWFGGIVACMVVIAVAGYLATLRYLKR